MHTYKIDYRKHYAPMDSWKDEELDNAAIMLSEVCHNNSLPDIDIETVITISELLTEYANFKTHEDLKKALINTVKDLQYIIDKINNYKIMHTYKSYDTWKGAELRRAARMIGEVANYDGLNNKDKKILLTIAELLTEYHKFKTHNDLKIQLVKTVEDFQDIINKL